MNNGIDIDGIGMTSRRVRERLLNELETQDITNEKVLNAILEVPRHVFVSAALAHRAYENTTLPIGYKQTISQPYIVALMTSAISASKPLEKILEIGTGSGYQTAILARFADTVFTVERIKGLKEQAEHLLNKLKIDNVHYCHSDGTLGWPEKGPYDAIIVTAAANFMVDDLKQQLKEGGRLVIPVGKPDNQHLHLVTRQGDVWVEKVLTTVRFVPLISGISD